jgi:DNA-binding NtrC family response regulator
MESLSQRFATPSSPTHDDDHAEPRLELSEQDGLRLGLSVRLDRPFAELKQFLVDELERVYVERCLSASAKNLSRASRISGLSRKHLRTLIAKHGLSRE